ncbi:transposase [candidate division WOR-3 bacterium]|uniref:Transposase n=1 Tax=candidate division WOR-3 bacterium TaxID=2052148 RepID=A0A937XG82_UNCW3|nr:transposase [candidate division WOR-3 bacterium]
MLGLLLALVCAAPPSRSDFQALRILYTGDLHGRSTPSADFASAGLPRRLLGGWDNLLRLIGKERTDATLLLDCGDFGFGSPAGDSSQGRAAVEFMNAAGYDAAVPGPRDFTGGAANFEILARTARFPILTDPTLDVALRRRTPLFRPYLVRDIMGVKLAVIGITDPSIPRLNLREDVGGWVVDDPASQMRRYLPLALAESADVVIAVGHLSTEDGCAIADSFREIDLVVCCGSTGAVENRMAGAEMTPVVTAAAFGQRLGIVDLLFNKTERTIYQTEVRQMNVDPGSDRDSSSAGAWLRGLDRAVEDSSLCLNAVEYLPDSAGLLQLGTLVAEAVRRQAKADIAVLPAYEIEAGLGAGPLNRGSLFGAAPYRRAVRLVSMDDTMLARLVVPEKIGPHEPAPLLAGADYFVTGDTAVWPEASQVGRVRVRNRLPGTYRVATTEQWLERAAVPVTGRRVPQSLTDLWISFAAAQETLPRVPPVRLYPATPGLVRRQTGGLVNINTASSELLQTLPGIGPRTAERIIQFRETVGRFDSPAEIQDVKGIGPKKFESIRDLITVR